MGGKARAVFGTVLALATLYVTGNPGLSFTVKAYFMAATVAYGAWSARDARKKAAAAGRSAMEDRKVMTKGGITPKYFVYGRQFMSGNVVFVREPLSREDFYFWIVIALPIAHPVLEIDRVWFGDEEVTPIDGFGQSIGGKFARRIEDTVTIRGTIPADHTVVVNDAPSKGWPIQVMKDWVSCTAYPPFNGIPSGDYVQEQEQVRSISAHLVDGTTQTILLGGEPGWNFTLTVSYYYFASMIRIWRYMGGADNAQACQELVDACANPLLGTGNPRWKASSVLTGIPYLVLRIHPDPDVFPHDLENITCHVWGKKDILDTRNGTLVYTDNPMLCARDYAVNQCGVLPTDINIPLLNDHANACDEPIPLQKPARNKHPNLPGQNIYNDDNPYDKRFRCNAALTTEAKPLDNLGTILSSCDGSAVMSGSTFDIRAGVYEEPIAAITIDDSDFVTAPEITVTPAVTESFNGVRGRYLNEDRFSWPMEDARPYQSPHYLALDGGRVEMREIDLPATTDQQAAQRLMRQMLHRARAALRVRAVFNIKALQLSPEQTVHLSMQSLGVDAKVMRIKSMRATGLDQFEVDMQEDGPLLYEHDFNEMIADPAPNTNLRSVRNVQDIFGLTLITNQEAAVLGHAGELTAQCLVRWAEIEDPLVLSGGYIELRHKDTSQLAWTNAARIPPTMNEYRFPIVRNQMLLVEVRACNAYVKGKWAKAKRLASDTPTQYLIGSNLIPNPSFIYVNQFVWGQEVLKYEGWMSAGGLTNVLNSDPPQQLQPSRLFSTVSPTEQDPNHTGYVQWTMGANRNEYISTVMMPVTGGQEYVAYVDVMTWPYAKGLPQLSILFYERTGVNYEWWHNPLSQNSWGTPSSSTPHPRDMKRLSIFALAPSWAVTARLQLDCKNGQPLLTAQAFSSSDGVVVIWGKPMLTPASPGQIELPPWRAT